MHCFKLYQLDEVELVNVYEFELYQLEEFNWNTRGLLG